LSCLKEELEFSWASNPQDCRLRVPSRPALPKGESTMEAGQGLKVIYQLMVNWTEEV